MHLLLVAGGILQDAAMIRRKTNENHYAQIIAVDRGYDHCITLGLQPDVLMGDLDSITSPQRNCKTISFPAEKDETDLHLAVDYALAAGATHIDILCATGGRLDQFMGNLSLLEYIQNKANTVIARIIDETNIISMLPVSSAPLPYQNNSKYVSVVPITDEIVLSYEGLKYPADHLTVTRQNMVSISNEAISDTFFITLHSGKAYLIQAE